MRKILNTIYQQISFKGIEPSILEAHQKHLLERIRITSIAVSFMAVFTVLPYFYFIHRAQFLSSIKFCALAFLGFLTLLPLSHVRFFQKHYHSLIFSMSAIVANIVVCLLISLIENDHGSFLFPYFLIDFGTAVLMPGNLIWISATLGVLPFSYLFTEWSIGNNILSEGIISNFINLCDCSLFGIIGNQVLLALFFRDKRNQLKLEMANEKLMRVASQVAHDLRSPLSSLSVIVDHLRGSPSIDTDVQNLLHLSYKRLHSITNDLLDKQRSGHNSKTVFSIHKVLDELIGELSSSFGSRIHFQKEYGEAIACMGDRNRLQRAFGNLLKNAAESVQDTGFIAVTTAIEHGKAIVTFTDTGCGMASDILGKALKGGYTTKKEGHGIGMTVVREVIEEHDGTLNGTSEVGKGTIFRITLPLPASNEMRSAVIEEGVGSFDISLSLGEAVVLIDDDPAAQLQWEMILRPHGHEILSYESFEDFDRKRSERTSLQSAIVDYHFDNSETDGLEIIKRLKTDGFTNLFLCTAEYWKPAVRDEAKKLDVPICPKPIPKVLVKHGP